ncbi:hypothetical protein CJP55_04015 [Lactobacillus plantarum]|nr:hypothetical protein [Lactiplantibacillus plantarum]
MRIVVEDVAASKGSGGVWSILCDFYQQVVDSGDQNEWYFIVSEDEFESTKNIHIIYRPDLKKNKVRRFFFDLVTGKKFINRLHPDIVFSLQNTITVGTNASRKVVYVHQPIPYQSEKHFSVFKKRERKLFFYQYMIGPIINYTLRKERPEIIVQTSWMKDALTKRKIANSQQITISMPNDLVTFNKKKVILDNQFFFPATAFLYKNHDLILHAVEFLVKHNVENFQVVCTVKPDELSWDHVPKQIRLVGKMTREDVMAHYQRSVLIFPSYIETFGLPLLEAAKTGTIIFASDTSFSREVLNGYENAYYFDFNQPEMLAKLMLRFLEGKIELNSQVKYQENKNSVHSSLLSLVLGEKNNG